MKKLLLLSVCVLSFACSDDVSMFLPAGPQGETGERGIPGNSAYECWVEAVNDGTIEWDEDLDAAGFFRFLKGKDGANGIDGVDGLDGEDGIDGVDGKTAYEIWVEAVGKGLDDPHNPGSEWNKDKTSMNDFYRYMTGKDGAAGISAYGLWVIDVRNGLIENPRDPGTLWPDNQTELMDFWHYLRGEDGEDGEQGIPGLSAYDEWQKLVDDGTVEWDGGTGPDDFFRFLKGKEGEPGADGKPGIDGVDGLDGEAGKDGTDGIDGIDGRSAYDIWVEAVGKGLDDPHNPGSEWDKGKTSPNDFYRYMTGRDGADGISAYGLWVLDVRKGIIENPHNPGTMWPDSQTTLMDFWHYLRGEDGEDGETPVPIVNPGQPGVEVPPVEGMPNVIALYKDQAHSEYVSTEDGSVLYQVWLASGSKAGAGVVVTRMPGIDGETFTTYADGTFKVPADKLPTSGTTAERFGTARVDGAPSAPNTYVPQKIDVRLMIGNSTYLVPELTSVNNNDLNGGIYMRVPVRAQRRITSEGEWENLPDYMAGINRTVRAYAVDADTVASGKDPTAPNMNFMLKHGTVTAQDLRGTTVSVRRPTMPVGWMSPATQKERYYMVQPNPNEPDYTPGIFTMVLDDETGFYGENPHTRAIITTMPVNLHPLPATLTMSVESASTLKWIGGSFDVSTIDEGLLSVARYVSAENPDPDRPYTLYGRGDDANDNKCFAVNFGTGTTLIGGTLQASVGNPSYTFDEVTPVVVGSYVYLMPTSNLIAGPGKATPVGQLVEKPGGSGKYVIEAVSPFTFDDIQVTITTP